MPTEPVLVLFSGPKTNNAYGRPEELAFHTQVGELSFTSCSGVYLTDAPGAPSGALLLAPLTAFKPWLKTLSSIDKLLSSTAPELLDGCCLCVVGPDARALPAIPLATVRLGASALSAQQLLRSLNREDGLWDEASRPWSLAWGVAGPPVTPAELASLVLCWVPPPAPPNDALAASYAAQQQQQQQQQCQGTSTNTAIVSSTGSDPPLLDPTCLSALHQLHRALTQMAAPPHPSHANPTPWPPHAHLSPHPHPPVRPGQLVRVVGSPFGCLAPFHFTNASINGAVACAFPSLTQPGPPGPHSFSSSSSAPAFHPLLPATPTPATIVATPLASSPSSPLLALDAAVLPGMEGAPVWPLAASSAAPNAGHHPHTAPHTAAQAAAMATAVTEVAEGGPLPHPLCPPSRPLALLVTPLRRRSDGVQIPLALPWAEVEQQLLVCLRQLLVQQQGKEKARAGLDEGCRACGVAADRQGVQGVGCATRQRVESGGAPGGGWTSVAARQHGGQQRVEFCSVASAGDAAIVAAQAASGMCNSPRTRSAREGGYLHQRDAAAHGGTGSIAAVTPPRPFPLQRSLLAGGSFPGAPPPLTPVLTARQPTAVALGAPACAGPPAWAVSCVVLLRHGGSWATGVRVGPTGRLLITTAHLFGPVHGQGQGRQQGQAGAGAGPGARAPRPGGAADAAGGPAVVCWARVAAPGDAGGYVWTRARVLYSWRNHLDLAVLRLEDGQYNNSTAQEGLYAYGAIAGGSARPYGRQRTSAAAAGPRVTAKAADGMGVARASQPLGLLEVSWAADEGCQGTGGAAGREQEQQGYAEGSPVWAVGHSLVGPAAGWPAAASYGCVAKVRLLRRLWRYFMLVVWWLGYGLLPMSVPLRWGLFGFLTSHGHVQRAIGKRMNA